MRIWTYWEQGIEKAPPWIQLGRETIDRHRGDFDLVTLDASNIKEYLPDLPEALELIPSIATRVDYIRVHLLERFGGVWLDLDIAAFPALASMGDLLQEHQLVSTGIHAHDITLAFLGAQPHGEIIGEWTELMDRAIRDGGPESLTAWGALGSVLVAPVIERVGYYEVGWERVYQLRWRQWPRFVSHIADERPVLAADPFVVCFFHHQMGPRMAPMTRERLIEGHRMISRIYRRSMGIEDTAIDTLLRGCHGIDDARWWLHPRVRPRVLRLQRRLH